MNETSREQPAQTAAPALPQQQPAPPSQAPPWSPIEWWANVAVLHERYDATIRAFLSLVSPAKSAEHAQRLFQHEFAKFERSTRRRLLNEILRQCPGHQLHQIASNTLEQEYSKPESLNPSLQVTNRGSAVNGRILYHDMGRAANQKQALERRGSDSAASGPTPVEDGPQLIVDIPVRNQEESHPVAIDPVHDGNGSDPFANHEVSFSHINQRIEAAVEAEDYANRTMGDSEYSMPMAEGLSENGESGGGDLPIDELSGDDLPVNDLPIDDPPIDNLPVNDLSPNDPPPEDPTQNETDSQEEPADTNSQSPAIADEAVPSRGSKRTHEEMNGTPSAAFRKYKDFVAQLEPGDLKLLDGNAKKDLAQAEADKAAADHALGVLEGRAQARPDDRPDTAEVEQAHDQHEKAAKGLEEAKKRVTALGHIERARYLHDCCIEAKDYRRKIQELLNETEEKLTDMEKAYHEAFTAAEEECWASLIAAERERQSN